MKQLSKYLEKSISDNDEDYFYDRIQFMKHNYEWDRYTSDDVAEQKRILLYDLETVNVLINQILRFGRIVYSTDKGAVYNFPNKDVPNFYLKDIFSAERTNTIKEGMNYDRNS